MNRTQRSIITFFVALVVMAGARKAEAHPHIFARYSVTLSPVDSGFIKLHFVFKAHSVANPFLTKNAQVGDVPVLTQDMFNNLQQHPFFFYLDLDGKPLGQQGVKLVVEGSSGDDQLYSYDVLVPDGLGSFGFSLYDPSYFDAVSLESPDSVAVKLNKITCSVQPQVVGKDPSNHCRILNQKMKITC